MTLSIADRINQLAQSGLGLSPQDIAAILGLGPDDVLTYMRDQAQVPGTAGLSIDLPDEIDIPAAAPTAAAIMAADLGVIPAGSFIVIALTAELSVPSDPTAPDQLAQIQVLPGLALLDPLAPTLAATLAAGSSGFTEPDAAGLIVPPIYPLTGQGAGWEADVFALAGTAMTQCFYVPVRAQLALEGCAFAADQSPVAGAKMRNAHVEVAWLS